MVVKIEETTSLRRSVGIGARGGLETGETACWQKTFPVQDVLLEAMY